MHDPPGETEKFFYVDNPKFNRGNKFQKNHSLLRCQTCGMLWARDNNGTLNIGMKMNAILDGSNVDKYLSGKKISGGKVETVSESEGD